MLEEHIPYPPGTPGNPTTFSHPVRYEIVRGVDISSLKQLNQPDSLPGFLAAAQSLVASGVSAVTGNCGLMIVHQAALAKVLPVPVFMSSLVQLPLIHAMLGPDAPVGIIASNSGGLKPEHLAMACGGHHIPTVVATMDGRPNFQAAICEQSGLLDCDAVEAEVVAVARALVAGNRGIGAILLECTDLPPYAAAIQEATGLPVFDITTLIDGALRALIRRPFAGAY
jgi:hypothetical protein